MTPIVVAAVPAHMDELARGLRARDRGEIIAFGSTIEESLTVTWRRSLMTQTVLLDGRVVAVGGCGGAPLGGVGEPWMLTTDLFARVPLFMVREGFRQVAKWLDVYDRLESLVDAHYRGACGYLELLGFTLGAPGLLDNGAAARRFWMERADG